jgi:uncharacterized UBP type Zn finger protein
MNIILQKRIVEAAKDYSDHNYVDEGVEVPAFIEGADFALKNQWISVEEALPSKDENIKYTDTSIRVLVRLDFDGEISHRTAIYSYALHKWSQYDKFVTHWMEIPSLEGGEE